MSKKQKAIIACAIALAGSLFGWYVAFSDGDPSTVPQTDAVIQDGKDLFNATQMDSDESSEEEVVEETK